MDHDRFDALARFIAARGSRRAALAALLGTTLAGALPDVAARKRGNGNGKGKGKGKRRRDRNRDRNRDQGRQRDRRQSQQRSRQRDRGGQPDAAAEAARCCSRGNCTPGKGKNLGKCCYPGQDLTGTNFQGANLGQATFAGATLTNANVQGANLGKACFVDADLRGIKTNTSTNWGGTILCRTQTDAGEDDSGCDRGTPCCPTCDAEHPCAAGEVCCQGRCRDGVCCTDAACSGATPHCCADLTCQACCNNSQCPDTTPVCASGQCVECTSPNHCPPPPVCQVAACTGNTCGTSNVQDGAECPFPTGGAGACSNGQCLCPAPRVTCNGVCCAAGQVCNTAANPNACCTRTKTTCETGVDCGAVSDGCGGTIACGTCPQRTCQTVACTSSRCLYTNVMNGQACQTGQGEGICCGGTCRLPAWAIQTTFGSRGSGPSQFEFPMGVAVADDELTVWVAEFSNHHVSVWTRPNASSIAWTEQAIFGSQGSGPGQFLLPTDVFVSEDELTAWVADPGNDRVAVWTRPNATSTAWTEQTTFGIEGSGSGQLNGPTGVFVAGDGLTAWVADGGNHRISVWTRPNATSIDWTEQTTFGSEGSGSGQLNGPGAVVVSEDGLTAWVVDTSNNRIAVWTRPDASSIAWTEQTTFGSEGSGLSQFALPGELAVAGDGLTVWVADRNNSRIVIWTRPNASSTAWSAQTTFGTRGSGSSQFNLTEGVAISADELTVWATDLGNGRVAVWRLGC